MLYEISWNFITAIARLDYHNDICEARNKCKKYKLQGIIVCLLPLRLFRFDCKSRIDKEFEKNERENIFFSITRYRIF